MKTIRINRALPSVLLILLFISEGSSQYRGRGGDDSSYSHCTRNCAPFSGQARYQCMKTCISAKRRSSPRGGRRNSKYSRCAGVCKSLKGLDSVKCIRLCMERGSTGDSKSPSRKERKSAMEKDCERRCEVLDGTYRYRCIRTCRSRYKRQ